MRKLGEFKKYFDAQHIQKTLVMATLVMVFLVGLVTVLQKISGSLPDISKLINPPKTGNVQQFDAATIKDANFTYLVPRKSESWEFDESTAAYDKQKDVVKYGVTLNNAQVNVVFSQQKFPEDLKPRKSNKFMAFINDSNPTRSQDAGEGTVYFLSSLENGVPTTDGTNTIIYATDDILMFGKAGKLVGYDGWVELLTAMGPH